MAGAPLPISSGRPHDGSVSQTSEQTAGALVRLSNSALSAEDRFAWYTDIVEQNIAPFTLTSAHAHDFPARIVGVDLGAVQVTTFVCSPLLATRTPRHIRRGDPETYQLAWIQGSPLRVSQRRSDCVIGAGNLVFFDTSHPLDAEMPNDGRSHVVTLLRLPKGAFPLPAGRADRILSRQLSSRGVTGSLFCQYLDTLLSRGAELGPADNHRLGTIAVDLAAVFLAGHLDAQDVLPAETRRQALLARIHAFIDQHLADTALTPAHIAAHHHLSLRSLHRLFRTEPESVAATIRRRRLERCRGDLADPRLRGQPISAVGARWGFLMPTEFSRAFRAAYDVTPREFRYSAGADGAPARQTRITPGDK